MVKQRKFYVTTSIPYVNAPPHIGHALEFVQGDVLARYHRALSEDVYFLTGTDEHGRKVLEAAEKANEQPQAFADQISDRFSALAHVLNISNDDFIRTTDRARHWPGVELLWNKLSNAGDLYKKQYRGLYCSGCESFKKPSDLKDGLCPDHKKAPEILEEENWFFRLSKYETELKNLISQDYLRVTPYSRKNETMAFINKGLEDVSFSRPRKDLPWGVPVPKDDAQTIYVWADALPNYITALGFGRKDDSKFRKFWPADVHVVGKDISRFHAIIWPAMLLSAKLPLPKNILVHGHILFGDQKMSKSLGNVVDPFSLAEKYGPDAVRYFLIRHIPTTDDGNFTDELFTRSYNSELADNLGNLVSRVSRLLEGINVKPNAVKEIQAVAGRAKIDRDNAMKDYRFHDALAFVMGLVKFSNEFVEQTKPWASGENKDAALPQLAWLLLNIAELLEPFLPQTAEKITRDGNVLSIKKGEVLFPRQ